MKKIVENYELKYAFEYLMGFLMIIFIFN